MNPYWQPGSGSQPQYLPYLYWTGPPTWVRVPQPGSGIPVVPQPGMPAKLVVPAQQQTRRDRHHKRAVDWQMRQDQEQGKQQDRG